MTTNVKYWSSYSNLDTSKVDAKMAFQIGPSRYETISVSKANMTADGLGLSGLHLGNAKTSVDADTRTSDG